LTDPELNTIELKGPPTKSFSNALRRSVP
jgi:hypothetical protein